MRMIGHLAGRHAVTPFVPKMIFGTFGPKSRAILWLAAQSSAETWQIDVSQMLRLLIRTSVKARRSWWLQTRCCFHYYASRCSADSVLHAQAGTRYLSNCRMYTPNRLLMQILCGYRKHDLKCRFLLEVLSSAHTAKGKDWRDKYSSRIWHLAMTTSVDFCLLIELHFPGYNWPKLM